MRYTTKLARNLKEHRKKLKLTQEEFSEVIDIHINYYSGLECGKRNPTLNILDKISNKLGISLIELLK